MARSSIYAAVDVGTTKICTIIAQLGIDGEVQVTGVGIAPAKGLRKGIVVNIEETMESLHASVERAERSSGAKVVSANIGIAGAHIDSLNNRGVVAVSRNDHLITEDDVVRVLEAARTVNIPNNRQVLHVLARNYILDGQEGVRNPVGMYGYRLDVETHIVTGAVTSIQNLTKCVQGLGIEVEDLVLQPLASSEAVLTDEEKELGVVLADIGGGTTDIALFIDGSVWHTAVLPVAGYQLTNDIAIGLRTPFATAEELKTRVGHAIPNVIDPEETVDVAGFGGDSGRSVKRREVAQLIRSRAEEILEMILVEVKRSGFDGMLPAGLVLTGGTANLTGFDALAREVLSLPVRVGGPRGIHGVVDTISDPAYATSVGLLQWGIRYSWQENKVRRRAANPGGVFRRLVFWAREMLPQ